MIYWRLAYWHSSSWPSKGVCSLALSISVIFFSFFSFFILFCHILNLDTHWHLLSTTFGRPFLAYCAYPYNPHGRGSFCFWVFSTPLIFLHTISVIVIVLITLDKEHTISFSFLLYESRLPICIFCCLCLPFFLSFSPSDSHLGAICSRLNFSILHQPHRIKYNQHTHYSLDISSSSLLLSTYSSTILFVRFRGVNFNHFVLTFPHIQFFCNNIMHRTRFFSSLFFSECNVSWVVYYGIHIYEY